MKCEMVYQVRNKAVRGGAFFTLIVEVEASCPFFTPDVDINVRPEGHTSDIEVVRVGRLR